MPFHSWIVRSGLWHLKNRHDLFAVDKVDNYIRMTLVEVLKGRTIIVQSALKDHRVQVLFFQVCLIVVTSLKMTFFSQLTCQIIDFKLNAFEYMYTHV